MSIRGGQLPRLAVADWSHYWQTRRDSAGGDYRSLGLLLDQLCERGYNCLRVDAFPHLIAARNDGVVLDRFELADAGPGGLWLQPRKQLLELATLARARDLRLWLTSSFLNDSQSRRSFVRRPGDYIDVWSQTLNLLNEKQLLETVVAVDFCHQFTDPDTSHGAMRSLFRTHPRNPVLRLGLWPDGADQAVESYLLEVPRALRAAYPDVAFGVSVNAATDRQVRKLDTTELDFLDGHYWLDDDPRFALLTGAPLAAAANNRLARGLQGRVAALAWRVRGTSWLEHWEQRLEGLSEFARLRRLAPALCGGFVQGGAGHDTRLVQQVSESVVNAALAQGVSALVTASQARPHVPSLWQDIDWHLQLTSRILTGPGR